MVTIDTSAVDHWRRERAWRTKSGSEARELPAWTGPGAAWPKVLDVRPAPGGWCVEGEDAPSLFFPRGAQAEAAARGLAKGMAAQGRDVRINVYDARNELAGNINYFGLKPSRARDHLERYPWRA